MKYIHPYKGIFQVLVFLVLFPAILANFPSINTKQAIMEFYQRNSLRPILHVYHNRHFATSKQFQNFQNVLNELLEETDDYMTIAYTDCEKDLQQQLRSCKEMRKTKDNRMIMTTYPSSQFIKMGSLFIQSPPLSRILDQYSDKYQVSKLKEMMNEVMPNFFKELHNAQEYEDFMATKYVPKIIVFLREDEDEDFPVVLKQLSVHFALKLDFGLIYDLNEELMPLFASKITKYPKFIAIKYNFEMNKFETQVYNESVLNEDNYERIKNFLQKYALKENRNDHLFHKISMETSSDIMTVESKAELEELKEKSAGWVITVKTPADQSIPQSLKEQEKSYGLYYSYIHFRDADHEGDKHIMTLTNPSERKDYNLVEDGQILEFNTLSAQDFISNMTIWLKKDFVVLGVVQEYGYTCAIIEKTLFRGHTRCLIVDEKDIETVKQILQLEFDKGFIVRTQPENMKQQQNWEKKPESIVKAKKVTRGVKLPSMDYQTVYRELQFATRMKLKQILDSYMQQPITGIEAQTNLFEACFHPTKKCFLVLTDLSKKDRTTQDYITDLAINYVSAFEFIELDINANKELAYEILGLSRQKKSELVVFYPKSEEFVTLNKKITRGLIEKFLRANQINDKRLKRKKLEKSSQTIIVRPKMTATNEEL